MKIDCHGRVSVEKVGGGPLEKIPTHVAIGPRFSAMFKSDWPQSDAAALCHCDVIEKWDKLRPEHVSYGFTCPTLAPIYGSYTTHITTGLWPAELP